MKYFLSLALQEFTVSIHFLNSCFSLCQGGSISPVTLLKKSIILIYILSSPILIVNLRGTMWCPQVPIKSKNAQRGGNIKASPCALSRIIASKESPWACAIILAL